MFLADSHAHFQLIEENIEDILKNNPLLKLIINVGTCLQDDFTKFTKFKEIYSTYGVHPNEIITEPLFLASEILKNKIISDKKLNQK